ncbi:hypothetical protein K491DRAFT_757599 [Lophiostoma macrostomum CBS 122681]|uniref:Uncharacterized protein n=1 Tax=Lophiostoma macrostomum CBS 122681 TaxID=1314788 RepID=A0A6A6T9L7_9PLEO|nr:hypothetical protein K491DRAFT_757599 [Lophiostoma macrostomum CBS 122681]
MVCQPRDQDLKRKASSHDLIKNTVDNVLTAGSLDAETILDSTAVPFDTMDCDLQSSMAGAIKQSLGSAVPQKKRCRDVRTVGTFANAMEKPCDENVPEHCCQFEAKYLVALTHLAWQTKRMNSAIPMTQEESGILKSISRTVQSTGSVANIHTTLTEDLVKAKKEISRLRSNNTVLCGPNPIWQHGYTVPILPQQTIDQQWKATFDALKLATGIEYSKQPPPGENLGNILGYLESQIYDLLSGGKPAEAFVDACISKKRRTPSGEHHCVLQTLVAALLCHYVFADSSLMFNKEHSGMIEEVYSLHSMLIGPAAVRDWDLRATKRRIRREDFQQGVQKAIGFIKEELEFVLRDALPVAPAPYRGDFYQLVDCAIHLKLDLLSCPMEYRILFCPLTVEYNEAWMIAEDLDGCPLPNSDCSSKKVRLPVSTQTTSPPTLPATNDSLGVWNSGAWHV